MPTSSWHCPLYRHYDENREMRRARKEIKEDIGEILQLEYLDWAPVVALRRQLWRYQNVWQHKEWGKLSKEAITLLDLG